MDYEFDITDLKGSGKNVYDDSVEMKRIYHWIKYVYPKLLKKYEIKNENQVSQYEHKKRLRHRI